MSLFIDTNVFLSFFRFTEDDLRTLDNLFTVAQGGAVNFVLPSLVIDEFERNRAREISESIKLLEFNSAGVPVVARELSAFSRFQDASKELTAARKDLINELRQAAIERVLPADALIQKIFTSATKVPVTDDLIQKAKRRVELGNPPGKSGSLGDAINWEAVMSQLIFIDELHFVSQDRDYCSPLDENRFNDFLIREYDHTNWGDIHFYKSLKSFLSKNFPEVEIGTLKQSGEAVELLESSNSFQSTHSAIAKLNDCKKFTMKQIERLLDAAESNSQVSWILSDSDVHDFFSSLESRFEGNLPSEHKARIAALIA